MASFVWYIQWSSARAVSHQVYVSDESSVKHDYVNMSEVERQKHGGSAWKIACKATVINPQVISGNSVSEINPSHP
jgi:hypothetical protein